MKILSATLAVAIAATTLGWTTGALAQVGPDAHQPMPNDQIHRGDMRPSDVRQDNSRGDMRPGDARTGDMHLDGRPMDNNRGGMRHADMRGDGIGRDGMRGGGMRGRHDWHRHCRMMYRHHHRVRVCR